MKFVKFCRFYVLKNQNGTCPVKMNFRHKARGNHTVMNEEGTDGRGFPAAAHCGALVSSGERSGCPAAVSSVRHKYAGGKENEALGVLGVKSGLSHTPEAVCPGTILELGSTGQLTLLGETDNFRRPVPTLIKGQRAWLRLYCFPGNFLSNMRIQPILKC